MRAEPATVLFAVESMERAGAEQVVLSLVTGLDRSRFRPVVCCLTEPGALAPMVEAQGVSLVALGKHPHFDLPVIPKLIAVIRKYRVKIVHSHVWPANVWGRVVGKLSGVRRLVVTEHNVDLWKKRPHFLVDRALARVTDRVLCVSRAVEAFYRDIARVSAEKLVYVPNGIDTSLFAGDRRGSARRELDLGERERVVAIVARLLPQKNHSCLLRAIAELRDRREPVTCLIAGDGTLKESLEQEARALGLGESVVFLGERRDVPRILAASDVVTLSSNHEGMPLAVLEGMAAGKPVVVTDVGGNRELVEEGVTGYVVPPGDASALAERIGVILRSPELADRMGAAGRERAVREFSVEAMVRRNEVIYQELLERA